MTGKIPQFPLGIINRYVFTETLGNFGVCIFIFTLTLLMSQIFKLTELVINKGFGLGETLTFIGYFIPSLLVFIIPISLLLGILITLGKMSTDGEVIACKASGISLLQILRPIFIVSILAYVITNLFTIYLAPKANYAMKELVFDVARNKAEIGLKERIFNSDFEGLTIYVNHLAPKTNRLKGVLISDSRKADEAATIIAEEGYLVPKSQELLLTLHLINGAIHRFGHKQETYQKIDFKTYNLNLDLQNAEPETAGHAKKRKEMSLPELINAVTHRQGDRENYTSLLVELHGRFAIPFACLVFTLLGVPLGVSSPRSGRSYGFVVGLAVILLYYILFSFGKNLGSTGVLSPPVAMWMPNTLFFIGAVYLFKKGQSESPVRLLEQLAWVIEILKSKTRGLMEGEVPEAPDHHSILQDINRGSKEELMLKLGIGENKAAAIVAYREHHGGILSLEELKEIRGIGEKTINKIKETFS